VGLGWVERVDRVFEHPYRQENNVDFSSKTFFFQICEESEGNL
jgi:hypothetical protein